MSLPNNNTNQKNRYKSRKIVELGSNETKNLLEQILKEQKANEEIQLTNEEAAQLTNEILRQRQRERAGLEQTEEITEESYSSSSSSYSSSSEEEDDDEDEDEETKDKAVSSSEEVGEKKKNPNKKTKQKKKQKKSKAEKNLDELKKSMGTPPYEIYDVTTFVNAGDKYELHVPSVWKDCLVKVPFDQVGVLLCRSGKFAISIFNSEGKVLGHHTASRYTIRKGQGKSQSAMDATGKKPKSIGAQLRRAGEVALNNDIATIFSSLQTLLEKTQVMLIHCPNVSMYHQTIAPHLSDDIIVKRIPLSIKRPSHQATQAIYQILTNCLLTSSEINRDSLTPQKEDESAPQAEQQSPNIPNEKPDADTIQNKKTKADVTELEIPLTPLHEAARDGDHEKLISLLTENENFADVNIRAGQLLWTPLHFASSQNHTDCITALFMKGNADPSVTDIRSRPPVFLCTNESSRNAYRIARHELGEEHASWTGVGPPTTLEQIQEQKSKKKQKQKQKKQKRKQAQQKKKEEEKVLEEENEKEEKTTEIGEVNKVPQNLCDFCKSPYKKRNMFTRLDYKYCSTDCVKKHQRELMATAAMARLGMKA